jgi:hypothetical protein
VNGVKVRKVWFNAPSADLIREYEAMKHEVFWNRLSEAQGRLGLTDAAVASGVRADRDRPATPPPAPDGGEGAGIPADLVANSAATGL